MIEVNSMMKQCPLPGPAPDGLQWLQRPGQRGGARRAEEGAAGVRSLEQKRRLLSGLQRAGRAHP